MGTARHILVVEDDPDLRRLWRLALTLEGFDVTEAEDGLEALRIVEERCPDLLVLDLSLPRVPGVLVQQELAARALTRDLPIVIVTASAENLDHLAVPCILRKPVMPDQLVRAVRRCLPAGASSAGL